MSMREKIAWAILKARFYDPEPHMYESIDDFLAGTYPEHWDEALAEADAVLDALMEPTEGMEAAAIQTDEVDSIDWVEALMGTGITSAQAVVVASYKSMVRAAKEGK